MTRTYNDRIVFMNVIIAYLQGIYVFIPMNDYFLYQ